MKNSIVLSIFMVISFSSTAGQGINLGFDINSYLIIEERAKFDYQTSIQKSKSTNLAVAPFPVGYFINFGTNISKEISLNIKGGLLLLPDLLFGNQLGAEARYKFSSGLELIVPYYVHFNDDSGGNSSGQSMNTLHLLGLGIGKYFTQVTSLELVYTAVISSDKQIAWSTDHFNTIGRTSLNSMIVIALRFNWSVLDFN